MSDADDQMGGTGGETGPDPSDVKPGQDNAAPSPPKHAGTEEADRDKE